MWIVTNKGFMSVVAKDAKVGRPATGRRRSSASASAGSATRALFPEHAVVATPAGDYACRVFATRAEVADVLAREVLGMAYSNFKSSIPADDPALHDAAMSAWTVFGDLQEGGPYGARWCKSNPVKPAGRRRGKARMAAS